MTGRFLMCALALLAAGAAFAQSDPIAARQAAMKEVGKNFGAVNRMNRAQTPYDAATASAAFTAIATAAAGFAALFPEESKTGGKTEASPAIWDNKADLDALSAKLAADASAAAAEAGKSEEAFKAAFTAVAQNCSGCHQKYRID